MQEQRTTLPIRYLLVFWLFILSAVAYLDRTTSSIAGVQIMREFAIDNTRLGWMSSAFLVGYAIFSGSSRNTCENRLGPRLILGLGCLWWSLFKVFLLRLFLLRCAARSLTLMLVRFALGAGEATMYPATSQFVERWFPVQERGKANGIIFGGVGIGSGMTPSLVTAIMLRYGWRASFWFSAMVGLVVGLVWYLAARNSPEQHPLVGTAEAAFIEQGRRVPGVAIPADTSVPVARRQIPWLQILSNKAVLAVTGSYFAYGYVAWIFFAWFYIYLAQVRGLNLKTSALYSTLPFIAMTIGSLSGGVISDWIAKRYSLRLGRCLLPALSLATTACLLVLGSRTSNAPTAAIILPAGQAFLYVAQSGFWAVTADAAGEHVSALHRRS